MSNRFGPWATSIEVGEHPQLSAFWKRRMAMLESVSQVSPTLSRRNVLWLGVVGSLMLVMPTFRSTPAVAEEEKPANENRVMNAADATERSRVKLPGGTTVELLAVGEKRSEWWKPDGSPADSTTSFSIGISEWSPAEGQMNRVFVLRIKAPFGPAISQFARSENNRGITISSPLLAVRGMPGVSAHMDTSVRRNEMTKEETIEGKLHGSFSANTTDTKVAIGLTLAWKTIGERDATAGDIDAGAGEVIFAPNPKLHDKVLDSLDIKGDKTFITIVYEANTEKEIRIVAIDQEGNACLAKTIVTRPGATPPTATWVFPMLAARIKTFLVQRSPYTWVEFRNVSVQPGHKTRVTGVVDGLDVAKSVSDASSASPTAAKRLSVPQSPVTVAATAPQEIDKQPRPAIAPERDNKREQAIRELQKAGANVRFRPWNKNEVFAVEFKEQKVADEVVAWIGRLPETRIVDLGDTKVSDAGLAGLSPLTNLEWLMLTETGITDEGVTRICEHKTLWHLNLGGTKITDDAIPELAKLPRLTELMITGNTRITDLSLERLGPLKSLKTLYLNGTRVTDDGLRHLKELPNLQAIGLYMTGITNEGVQRLAEIPSLRHIELNDTRITTAALDRLGTMPNLEHLEVSSNKGVSKSAVEEFKKAHPRWVVETYGQMGP